jgi:LPS-assembly protein
MMRTVLVIVALLAIAANARPARAQPPPEFDIRADTQDRLSENHFKLIGHVEMTQGDMKIYADEVEFFEDQDRATASGNVTFSQGANTISADRAEVDTKTHLGKFYNASGIATLQPQRQRPTPGAIAVPTSAAGQLTDVYFFGDVVEKTAVRRYKITNGGFSTCVQPTPRWDLHADTVELNIDHYTLLKQVIFNVKGVPMLYVPFVLYPTKEDGRATGFLIPTYGSSSIRGQSIHNAFFWAINRSQDATFMHDWYSHTGQAFGSEYRYNRGTGDGTMTAQVVNDRAIGDPANGGIPATKSYEIRGSAIEALAPNVRLRGNVDYFSSVTTMQTFNTNLYDASRNNRTIGVNLVGTWRNYFLNGTFNRTEYFNSDSSSVLTGTSPQIALTKTERELFPGSQLYFGGTTEFDHFDRRSSTSSTDTSPGVTADTGLSRFDIAPQIRYPFKKWQWFTVNTTVLLRDTFYTRSQDPSLINPVTGQPFALNQTLNRDYYAVQAQAIGPVFSRVWSTPDNGYAEKFKHTIEPVFAVARTSTIDNFANIIQTDGIDQAIGTVRYDYGLNNRFYAKRKVGASRVSQAQEILTISIAQSYYTNNQASQYDRNYQTSYNSGVLANYTPVRLDVRGTPTPTFNTTLHAEYDSHDLALRLTQLNATYNWTTAIQTSAGWTRTYFIPNVVGFNNPANLYNQLNWNFNAQTRDTRYGVRYGFAYDVHNATLQQQTLIGFYNAQCCGIAFQYAPRNFTGNLQSLGQNRTFFISFTLAGLGNFSPMNGALGGVPR